MTPRHIVYSRHILNLAILLHAFGLFLTFFRGHHTNFGNYMFMVLEIDHSKAFSIETIAISIFLFFTVINVFFTRFFILFPIFLYILFEAWAGYFQGGYIFSELTFGAQVLRYVAPLSVLVLATWPFTNVLSDVKRTLVTSWILRIGIAVVFITHGAECLLGSSQFVDLIIGSGNNLLGIRASETTALQIMKVIGIVDIIVAIVVLIKPNKPILMWAIFWALITALSRMTALGIGAYTEVLMRASHVLGPLAVYILNRPHLFKKI